MQRKNLESHKTESPHYVQGSPIRLTGDFSTEILLARREDMYEVLKEGNCQQKLPYPAKLSFIYEGEIKTSHKES